MPYCPECRSEYRAGFTHCKTCVGGPALVEALPVADRLSEEELESGSSPVGYGDGIRTVEVDGRRLDPARVFVLGAATDLRDLLVERGVAAAVVPIEGIEFPDAVTRFEVRVRDRDVDRAHAIIADTWREQVAREGVSVGDAPQDLESCPACGAKVPLSDEECPDCGLVVGSGAERGGDEAAQ